MSAIEQAREGGWLTIWFNQPDMRNPMTDEMVGETIAALHAVRDDRTVRGVTLRGRGGVFSAGGNLRQFVDEFQDRDDREATMRMSRGAARILDAVRDTPQVTVALVEGAAVAGGLGIVCACDLVVVERRAVFALSETRLGLTPAQISPFVVEKLGMQIARRLMLTAARFGGQDALEMGLADYIGDTVEELEAHEQAIRKQVMITAPGAVAALKRLLRELPGKSREAQIELAAENFTNAMLSAEGKEGVAAFFNKQKPSWARAD